MSDLRVKTFLFPVFSIDIPTGTASITPQITNVDAAAPETLSVYPYKGSILRIIRHWLVLQIYSHVLSKYV